MGLFRLPGGGALNDVYKKFIRDRCNVDIEPIAKDPLALSTFLKRVLASIAGGFLPLVLAVEDPKQYDEETLVDLIIAGLRSMGTPHLAVLFAVIRYFKETLLLDEYTQITKQSPLALGNLFPTPFFRLAIGDDYMIAGKRNADAAAVIKLLIERGDHIMAAVGPLNPARIPSPPPAPLKQKPPVQHPEPPQRNQSLVAVTDSAATLHTSSVDSIIDSSGVGKRRRLRKVRFFRCCCGRAQED
ncbi:hypothetical protein HK097_003654 [Rhizophlyctis rosea]|uniref:Rho-GAP domain-containing protein n=1 Tax=Rhizophlyctis rosea TaxID=64517 RepID=A0AAD5X2X5_9FUNG|nr:hypothetical protein HK097_003654 [Rhizophlyctis rosea]